MHGILRDVRYGIRSLLKSPGLTLVATLALTLGIGLTTTMFSIVYGALMKGLPYPDGDRIMIIQRANPARGITRQNALPIQDYFDYKAQQHSFGDLATITSGTIYVSGEEKAERFDGSWISANTFDIVGVRPMLGRNFQAGEDTPSGEKVAILAYSTWRQRYNGDANIIGKRIRVNGVPYSVVGVMPEGFAFPNNDNIRHHVYSLSPAKKFELPLYAGVPAEPVTFDKEGFVTLGCNIHDWMIAYVAVLATPYFQVTDKEGRALLKDLPPGQYTVEVWQPSLKGTPEKFAQHIDLAAGGAKPLLFTLDLKPDFRAKRAPGLLTGGYR
jgi:hypothetical protein